MPTDQQISILVDIATNGGVGIRSDKLADLQVLVAAEYVERSDKPDLYKLTSKGLHVLEERGVGANES